MLYSPAVIDWRSLFFNSFWIVGTAVILAGFSYHYWQAQVQQISLKEQLAGPTFSIIFWSGFVLITIGLIGTSQSGWEMIVWAVFCLLGSVNVVQLIRDW